MQCGADCGSKNTFLIFSIHHPLCLHYIRKHILGLVMLRLLIYSVVAVVLFSANGCDSGLNPDMVPKSGFISGMIRYKGGKTSFPAQDSVKFLTVVAFREVPKDSSILLKVLSGEAYFLSDALPYGVDSTAYTLEITKVPDTLRYICVGQQYGANINSDWRVVGIYSVNNTFTPSSLLIVGGQKKSNIDFTVDFANLPPQPFKR